MVDDSVTQWLDRLRDGEEPAAELLWRRYFETLVEAARKRLSGSPRRVADEEDIAISAFGSFCRNAAAGRFPDIQDRDGLWRLLFTITEYKVLDQLKFERRKKRGGGRVRGESVFLQTSESANAGLGNAVHAGQPTPEFAAEVADQVRYLLDKLEDDALRRLAVLKMEGCSNEEIAVELEMSPRSVTRKLKVIRTVWFEGLS